MSRAPATVAASAGAVALLLLLPLFPPEISGASATGAALLLAMGAACALRSRAQVVAALLLALAAWPLSIASRAPGAAPGAMALPLLALAAAAVGAAAGARTRGQLKHLLAGVGVLCALHALWQVAYGLERAARALAPAVAGDPMVSLAVARLREGRAFASFATPAALGCFLALALPVTVAAAWEARKGRGGARLLLAGAAAVQAAGLAVTQSATAVGALALAGGIAALRHAGLRRVLLPALLVLLALLAAIAVLRRDRLLDPTAAQGSWRLRAGNAAAAVRMIRAHPVLGVGPGAFAEVYPSVLRPGGNEVRHAHDLPLELVAELGLPLGLLAAAAFVWVFLGPLLGGAPVGLAVGLGAFALQNLLDFTAFFPSLLWVAALLRGTLAAEAEIAPGWQRAAGALALAGAALVTAGAGLSADARRAAADLLASNQVERSLRLARRAVALAPWEPDARLLHGAVLLRAGKEREALHETESAIQLSPVRPAAHAQRGRVHALAGDLPGAYADLRHAAALYPARAAYAQDAKALGDRLARTYRGPR